ncbi:MAG: hypothetical protein AMJ55_10890 [Gammaproteobacteria bacterium SG8_15]|jgi:hypothetical protein|nr:MAG: hypothetical protein AMJ55_10890 [Gammaproteobacteria bacterium SG8_15]
MIVKKTLQNQVTLPSTMAKKYSHIEYFHIREDEGRIILVPLNHKNIDDIRSKLAELCLTEEDINEAVDWARKSQ